MSQSVSDPMADYEATVPRSKFRLRFSLLALFLFVTLACLALAWLVQPERMVATTLFEVQRAEPTLFGGELYDEREFEIFKSTQLAKLSSYYVLQAAVRDPGIASLSVFQNQRDPVAWLQEHLEVEFPSDAEIMAISLRGTKSQANELVSIVDAVAKAYQREVLYADSQRRLTARDLKAVSLKAATEQLADMLQQLSDLKKEAGAAANDSVDIKLRQLQIDILTELVRETSRSLERDDLEAKSPSRITKVQNAVIGFDR